MLIITYLIFIVCYHIHCACLVATGHTALAPMIRVGRHHFVWMDMSNVNGIGNCTNFQMYSSFGINLHNKVSALLYGCSYLLAWWYSNITIFPTLYWCGMCFGFLIMLFLWINCCLWALIAVQSARYCILSIISLPNTSWPGIAKSGMICWAHCKRSCCKDIQPRIIQI